MTITYDIIFLAQVDYYTEGPVLDKEGNVYFTMLTGGKIMKIVPQGKSKEWASSSCPNGQFIERNGDHLICDSKLGKVLRYSPDGIFLGDVTKEKCAGEFVQVPNDLIVSKKGNIYFTDSNRENGKVFFVGLNGEEEVIVDHLDYPNGLVLSDDEESLFVAESYRNRILRFLIDQKGKASGTYEVFAKLPVHPSGEAIDNLPDGIAWHEKGILAVAHYGMQAIHLINRDGEILTSIDTGLPCTSNVIFSDDQTMIVTGGYAEPGPGAVLQINFKLHQS